MSAGDRVLLVAGEPSGDRIAAGIARALARRGVRCFGMGGLASAQAGVDVVADMRRSVAMGLTEVAGKLPALALSFARLLARSGRDRPAAAVLVNYTEYNLLLARQLRRQGVAVLWCVAPQVWAWRASRTAKVARAVDSMAVILPFEEALWRRAGVDAHYVGHPVLDVAQPTRAEARACLELEGDGPFLAVLPGSRPHEVRRLAPAMLAAAALLRRSRPRATARVLATESLDPKTIRWLREKAAAAGVDVVACGARDGASPYLPAFDAALVASGTATLESVLAGAPPVVVYRLSPVTGALARRMIRTKHVALPNIVLEGAYYPELLQRQVEPRLLVRELDGVLERREELARRADELRRKLACPLGGADGASSAERTASLAMRWVGTR
jgi:lipid-A-disaccharide synthase